MKYFLSPRHAALVAMVSVSLYGGLAIAQESEASAPLVGTRPAMNALTPQPVTSGAQATSDVDASNAAQGDVADLMQMIRDARLVGMGTTYNGSYGASLFFYPQEMTYYVALFQDRHFWRVIRSQDDTRAEAIYAGFAQQTSQLAEVELRRTQLQAQKAFLDRVIALSEDRAERLQADLDVARTQQARVNDHQRQVQGEAGALSVEKDRAQMQLRELQRQVQQLQRQTEAGLPAAK